MKILLGFSCWIFGLVATGQDSLKSNCDAYVMSIEERNLGLSDSLKAATGLQDKLYFVACELELAGEVDQALENYKVILRDYPNCDYVPYCWIGFAEHYFFTDKIELAFTYYMETLKYPRLEMAGYIYYKYGLCKLKMGATFEAYSAFSQAQFIARDKENGDLYRVAECERSALKLD